MGGRELASDQIFKKRVGRDRISVFEGGLLGKRRVVCFRGIHEKPKKGGLGSLQI